MSRHYKFDEKGNLLHRPSSAVFVELPSVTTIISDCTDKSGPLCQWSSNMNSNWIRENCDTYHEAANNLLEDSNIYLVSDSDLEKARFNYRDVSKTALTIGSAVHKAIEVFLMTGKELCGKNLDDRIELGFIAFLDWFEGNDVRVISVEQTVRSKYWAGTLDLLCEMNGLVYVIDFKTSKAIYPADMGPQIAAYRSTYNRDNSTIVETVQGSGILRLDKETGEPEWKDFSKRYEQDLFTFNRMAELFFARHPILAKKAGYKED
jgi:hypothetical protein